MECNANVKPVNGVANIWESAVVWFKKNPNNQKNPTSGSDDVQVLSVLQFQMCIVKDRRCSNLIYV